MPARPITAAPLDRQRGAFAVMAAVLILVILGFCGFAIDLGRMYNRKAELQTAADTIALAAASKLDGTSTGMTNAGNAAAEAALDILYDYNSAQIAWDPSALSFTATPGGSASASGAENLFFVTVDTNKLAARHGEVSSILSQLLSPDNASRQISSVAVAGRSSMNVLPLAICAMSNTEGQARGSELVEYGFRRGISYDLMDLNPNGTTKGANYLVNPVAPAGTVGTSVKARLDVIQPFVCTGTVGIPRVTGSDMITVEPDFPLDSVYLQLNSRFGTYTAPCTSATAPPDTNVKAFTFSSALPWMNDAPSGQSADPKVTATARLTLPDLPQASIPGTTTPGKYGPLWLYAKAAKASTYVAGVPEAYPSGYPTFGTADWSTLYTPSTPNAPKIKLGSAYPSPTPYAASTQAPPNGLKGVANRRVLNVPLLQCPVTAGSPTTAKVLAIARFFMTVPATDTQLYAEYAGLVQPATLVGQAELYK